MEIISKNSANSWGVAQQDVKDLWRSNGDLTSSFGTVVHKALEHYNRFRETGDIISKKRGVTENYCMPKHPILKGIVTEFSDLQKREGKIYSEVLISDINKGICGQADIILVIDPEKKICRVQDFKINIESTDLSSKHKPLAPFNSLPANKITKYQIQMSVYANMLQTSGWTVEGMDVFVYEDSWLHHELSVLNVIN